jgi:hypothetical protein
MAWTKQQLVEEAYGELALAGHVFDLDADMLEAALKRLDTMMAEWAERGIDVGYLLPSTPEDSNIGDDSGLPYSAGATVWANLAVRLAAGHGKTVTAETRATANSGYGRLLGTAVAPAPGQPSSIAGFGAGNKPWRGM